jgi:hypothetical protein
MLPTRVCGACGHRSGQPFVHLLSCSCQCDLGGWLSRFYTSTSSGVEGMFLGGPWLAVCVPTVAASSGTQHTSAVHVCVRCVVARVLPQGPPILGGSRKRALKYPWEKHWECVAASLHMAATPCPRAQYHLCTRLGRCVSPTIDTRCM